MNAITDLQAEGLSTKAFQLIVLPTEKCNFRCTYCYGDYRLGRMAPQTVAAIVKLLSRRLPALETLQIAWFGGEPLLALPIIEEVNGHVLATAPASLRFRSSITTNGWLLSRRTFARLIAHNVRTYQISFDGPAETHDLSRVTRKRGQTFRRIMDNVASALETSHTFRIALRLHLRQSTLAAAGRFIGLVAEEFGGDPRLTVYLKPVQRLGGPDDSAIDMVTDLIAVADLQAQLEAHGLAETDAAPAICYAAAANSFAIRPDGRVAKCTVAWNDPRNTIGMLTPEGTLAINQERLRIWIASLLDSDAATLSCPWNGLAKAPANTDAHSST